MQDETETSSSQNSTDSNLAVNNTTTGNVATGDTAIVVQHNYYEVANDLLSKPNALCDIIETEGSPSTVIFCNSPSDADLIDVMLKKRGISVRKLVGHIPPAKATSAMREAKDGQLTAVVVTDIAARNIEVEDVDIVINYSVPTDPESYIHRMGRSEAGGKRHVIISLVGPLDIGNFHYIKKFVNSPFNKIDLPSGDTMAGAKIKALSTQAERQALQNDSTLAALAKQLLDSPSRDAILAFLLHNTLNVLPNLKSSSERSNNSERTSDEEGPRSFRSEHEDSGRGDRRSRQGGRGRDRRDRGYGDRSDRGGDRNGRSSNRGRRPYEEQELRQTDIAGRQGVPPPLEPATQFDDDYEQDAPRHNGQRRGGRFERGEPMPPPQRDVRIYIGTSAGASFSEDKFRSLVNEHASAASDKVKRFSQRGAYSFVDIAEEAADEVVSKLADVAVDGNKLLLKKAATINVPRPREDRDSQASENEAVTPREATEEAGDSY